MAVTQIPTLSTEIATPGLGTAVRFLRADGPDGKLPVDFERRFGDKTRVVAVVAAASGENVARLLAAGAAAVVEVHSPGMQAAAAAAEAGLATVPWRSRLLLFRPSLSFREASILAAISRGMTNGEIAAEFYLERSTVKSHIRAVYSKIAVASREEATAMVSAWKRPVASQSEARPLARRSGSHRGPLLVEAATPSLLPLIEAAAGSRGIVTSADQAGLDDPNCSAIVVEIPPGSSPIRLIAGRKRTRRYPVLAVTYDPATALRAMGAGASGVVFAEHEPAAVRAAIDALESDLLVFPKSILTQRRPPRLSLREQQVLALARAGLSNRSAANRLDLAESTVKTHLSSAYRKLGVSGRAEAVAAYQAR